MYTFLYLVDLPRLSYPPETTATVDMVTLQWQEWEEGRDVGDGPINGYNVYYKEAGSDQDWTVVSRNDRLELSETIDGLTPDTDYVFAVSVEREGTGGEGEPLNVTRSTKCEGRFLYNFSPANIYSLQSFIMKEWSVFAVKLSSRNHFIFYLFIYYYYFFTADLQSISIPSL